MIYYIYKNGDKNKVYKIISDNARMKDINTGEWIDCVIYAPLYKNQYEMFSREKKDFYEKFEKVNADLPFIPHTPISKSFLVSYKQ